MLRLEDIKTKMVVKGVLPGRAVSIVQVEKSTESACTIYYKTDDGTVNERVLFRSDEEALETIAPEARWTFDASGDDFKMGLEAYRISRASLFDPMLAMHISSVEPLPHQISAVYQHMLQKQPLRFVLADDPGAGKTIMAGLLIRELVLRGDAKRILIVSPGSLTEQWQDELLEKFNMQFEIFSREKQEQCPTGNFFSANDQLICRLDQLSRNKDFQDKLKASEWDIIIVDEAHKLSASTYGNNEKKTRRFELGELLGSATRHFLLMTATPHNGKENDFQLWLSLLDRDRFYGRSHQGTCEDISDIMRRMVKEDLLRFDGTPLFPERRAYTVNYMLSDAESALYESVTTYVRKEMNRADKLDGQKKNNVGFALTILQRRLASSPEAIYQSLKRRKQRLEKRLTETRQLARGVAKNTPETLCDDNFQRLPGDLEADFDELSGQEYEQLTEEITDMATAAKTIPELQTEIDMLADLEQQARKVVYSGNDKKWEEMSALLQEQPEMFGQTHKRRKLIIFTEHKDTLNYLKERISRLFGDDQAVKTISGSTRRDARRKVQEEFRHNPDVMVLIATDAAGEGVNLQNANLMVNYDLPWNPNRLEQRFGRIHRIGQKEVCHLWNIVANETREGEVFQRLFTKIETERKALGGKVFDVLGEAFDNVSLKDLLVEAIRYGERPEVQERMNQVIDSVLDTEHLKAILKRNALVDQHMSMEALYAVKDAIEKAEARKLQPHFVRSFFSKAFETVGGESRPRESHRFEIRHVPKMVREYDKQHGNRRSPVLKKYERICFDKAGIHLDNKPMAELIHPKHPLMNAVTEIVWHKYREAMQQGTLLYDPNDDDQEIKLLFAIEHSIKDVDNKPISHRLQFVLLDKKGKATNAGWAPHLSLQPLQASDKEKLSAALSANWLKQDVEKQAIAYAMEKLIPVHCEEIKTMRERQADKTLAAVHKRLVKAISDSSDRAIKIEEEVKAGRQPAMQLEKAKRTVEELSSRLKQRTKELNDFKQVQPCKPVVISGALVIPKGLLQQTTKETAGGVDTESRKRVEHLAMQAVINAEKSLGHQVFDVSAEKCGWDITARPAPCEDGSILPNRHIEVKGRAKGQTTITVTSNEVMSALNQGEQFLLAIVIVDGDVTEGPFYIKQPFDRELSFDEVSTNISLDRLLVRSVSASGA